MKTVIFLISSAPYLIDFYNFEFFRRQESFRLVAIINQNIADKFPEASKKTFDKIYPAKTAKDNRYNTRLHFDDVKEIVGREISFCETSSNMRIFTYNEFNIFLAAKIREFFRVPGMAPEDLLNFKDKVVMKDILQKNRIAVPKFLILNKNKLLVNPLNYFYSLRQQIGVPFIIKPTNASGSYGVKLINNYEQFLISIKELNFDDYDYEVEEYINGELYHCDSYVRNGKILTAKCSRYNYPLLDFCFGKNVGSIALKTENPIVSKIITFNNTIQNILNPPNGIVHTEIFISNKNDLPVFLESSLKPPGAYIIPMLDKSFGVNLLNIDFADKMNLLCPEPKYNVPQYFCFWASFPKLAGKVNCFIEPQIKSKYWIRWTLNPGDETQLATTMRDKAASFFAWNNNYTELQRDFDYISDHSFIALE